MTDHWRNEWSDVEAWFAPMGVATGLAVHHTATPYPPPSYDPEWLRNVEHAEIARGYNALAYHAVFFDDGTSAESRPYGAMGAATGGHNGETIALCYAGYFHPPYNQQPTQAAIDSMDREVRALIDYGFLTADAIIAPHTWWTAGTQWATACCGELLIPRVPEIDGILTPPPSGGLFVTLTPEEERFVVNALWCMFYGKNPGAPELPPDQVLVPGSPWHTIRAGAEKVLAGGPGPAGGLTEADVERIVRKVIDGTTATSQLASAPPAR